MRPADLVQQPAWSDLLVQEVGRATVLRRELHAAPELMFEEVQTSALIQRELRDAGVEFVAGLAKGTGVLAHLPGGDGEAIGLRADMDALPIVEQTNAPWTSRHPGRMHACGHDGHVAILLGAMRVLREISRRSGLPRPVTLLFQPGEEGGGGGRLMVEEGCLDGSRLGPPLARIYGLHGWPTLRLGRVATCPGPMLAASEGFEVVVDGFGGHAALPQLLRDPLRAVAEIVASLSTLVATEVAPADAAVVTTTFIQGGTAFNVIPPSVRFGGTIRTIRESTSARLRRAIERRCHGVAAAHDCAAKVSFRAGFPVTVNDPECCRRFEGVMEEVLGATRIEAFAGPTMGSEDFSYYGQKIPACFFALGLHDPGEPPPPPLHSPMFDFEDRALPTAISAMVSLALAG